jgi:hypothetical protein
MSIKMEVSIKHWWNETDMEKLEKSYWKENCTTITVATTSLKWIGPESNLGFRNDRGLTAL